MEVGKAFTLRASAPGYTSVQWFKDGVLIPGATSTPYTKENVTLEDAGKYKAVFQTPNGEITTNEATVTVSTITIDVTEVKFKEDGFEVTVDKTVDLSGAYVITPPNATDKKVTWKSSDPKVATVTAKGIVKGISEGASVITITSHNGLTSTSTAYVSEPIFEIESITITPSTKTLIVNEKFTPEVKILPVGAEERTVNWDNEDDSVASRNVFGEFTAHKVGTTTFTASNAYGNITATLKVTVKAADVPVTKVTLDKSTLDLTEGDTSSLKVTIEPSNATDKKVTWKSTNIDVATVSTAGLVTAIKEGTATITATAKGGVKADCLVSVKSKPELAITVEGSGTTQYLKKGDTKTLKVTTTPEDLDWEVGDDHDKTVVKASKE